jgi:uncharacterized membrane protein
MQLIPDWAPNIHPMIVHFPITLFIIAVFFDVIHLFFKKYDWISKSALALYTLGVIAFVITFFTGRSAADGLDIPTNVIPALTEHADWAEITLWFFITFTIVRLIISFWPKLSNKFIIAVVVVIGFVGIYFLFQTADHGAKLVFGYGLGTGNISVELSEQKPEQKEENYSVLFSAKDDGSWNLEASQNAVSILKDKFRWIESSADDASLMYDEENSALMFHPSEKAFFVYDNKNGSVQVLAKVNIDDLDGELELVHHFINKNNYDFLGIENGKISLSRKVNGKIEIFEKDKFSANGWIELKVISHGTHYRGYMNNKLIVHGHGDEPAPGSAGLRISGKGIVGIKIINVEIIEE